MLTHQQKEIAAASVRNRTGECFMWLPLSPALAASLALRRAGKMSRIELAALRRELFVALDAALGSKGHL